MNYPAAPVNTATVPVSGSFLAHSRANPVERAFHAADLHLGVRRLVTPTITQSAFLARTNVTYVHWAVKRQGERAAIEAGAIPLVPPHATALLTTLQQIAPEAHIAGGAVRDTILQKQIHDIDVFMDDEHVEEAAAVLRSACGYVKVGEWKHYLGFSDPAMRRVAKFEKADETITICIIGV